MAKKKEIDKVKLSAFPEEVDKDGLKWYGEMSYETQMAVLSHYLHADKKNLSAEEREEIIYAVREFSLDWNVYTSRTNFVDFGEKFTKIFVY